MKSKPYKLIFTLLIVSVVFVLALQAFWIRNFYMQKRETLNLAVYSALEQVSNRLNDLENMRAVKDNILITRSSSLPSKSNFSWNTVVSKTTNYSQIINPRTGKPEIRVIKIDSNEDGEDNIVLTDSVVRVSNGRSTVISKTSTRKMSGDKSEIDRLMDKMLLEIKVIDSGTQNADTIKNIIWRVFANKGLFLPFEFALKKMLASKTDILLQSPGFRQNAESFVSDLSANRIFNSHMFLFVQMPGHDNLVLSSMKNILIICLFFSLLIIAVFYYSMRLILNQKKLSEVKTDFVNNMTHELKTPIATISLATDALNNPLVKNDEEKFRDYTRILKEENLKLNSHVERVLQMAMLEKGELKLYPEPVNLVHLIENSIQAYKLQAEESGATIHFLNRGETIVRADRQHLQAVFNNLLDNALKYSDTPCYISISISDSAKGVTVCFKDNGIGIAPDKQQKVFEQFYRAQGGNLHDVKGFGLGLSYVKSIVEAHGGTLELESQEGKGSEFRIIFKRDV